MFEFVLAFLRNPANPALQKAILALPAAERALLADDASYYMVEGLYDLLAHGCARGASQPSATHCRAASAATRAPLLTGPCPALLPRAGRSARSAASPPRTPRRSARRTAPAPRSPATPPPPSPSTAPTGSSSTFSAGRAAPPPPASSTSPARRRIPSSSTTARASTAPRSPSPRPSTRSSRTSATCQVRDRSSSFLGSSNPKLIETKTPRSHAGGLLQNLDWSNLLLAGGAVVASLMPTPPSLAVTGHPMYDERSMSSWFRCAGAASVVMPLCIAPHSAL